MATRLPTDGTAIALLEEMVRIPSLSGEESALAAHLADAMARMGLDAEVDAAGNAVGSIGRGPRHVVLVGHMDTVAGVVPVRRERDLLYGRGTVDAKGPLAAFVVAAARVGRDAGLRITVVGAVEEEAATSKGARFIAGRMRPDYAVIGEPSGWSRITIGYKGRLLIDYCLTQPAAHSAGEARGAPEEAVAFWQRVADWAEGVNRGAEGRFATVDPSLRVIRSSSDGLAERVEMTIGLRLPVGLDVDDLLCRLEDWRGNAEVGTRGREAAYRAEKRNALTSAFLAAIRTEGERAAFVTKTGTSDMNVLGPLWGCPMVAYGPGDSSLDHTPEEHVDLGEYLRSIRVLEGMLGRLERAG